MTNPPVPQDLPYSTPTPLSVVRMDVPFELVPHVERLLADARRPRPWFDLPLGIGLGLFAAVVTWLMLVTVPRFEEIFRDFGTRLPTPTVLLLNASRFFGMDYGWVIFWVIAAVVPVAVARIRPWPPRHRGLGATVSVIVMGMLLGLTLIAVYAALMLPMVSLIQQVSGGASKR